MSEVEILVNGDFRYAWRRQGDKEAPAIVLLMGLGLSMEAWPQTFIRGLLDEGFQVVTPDNRDSGNSSRINSWNVTRSEVAQAIFRTLLGLRVTAEYALEDMALDVERLLDALNIRRAHVVGFSMGGMIAQTLASQCPNRVATLISISSASGNPRTGLGRLSTVFKVAGLGKSVAPGEVDQHLESMLRELSGSKYPPTAESIEAMRRSFSEKGFDVAATSRQLVALLASGNRVNALRQLRTPTLVIHGTADPLIPFAAGEEVANVIAGAKLISVEGLGHQLATPLMKNYAAWIAAHCHAHPA